MPIQKITEYSQWNPGYLPMNTSGTKQVNIHLIKTKIICVQFRFCCHISSGQIRFYCQMKMSGFRIFIAMDKGLLLTCYISPHEEVGGEDKNLFWNHEFSDA